ncbi:nitrogenase component 1 [Catenisphaera adipataccumulans]|uniref:Nitrogenase molybdenum-iron protein alpha/beta subunit n=1 Tax=Catenisphaera adipataccumulans TaxID=700500 RepID=A0A7W8FTZ6_9FIRM|nr:nitrogenase component 1 [Catenisphaera adipataccumulans]MBB5182064.1 nitrogenase molybdenum-iron protein alpha/beta subunit [Catenisphaera adipataccumulans]
MTEPVLPIGRVTSDAPFESSLEFTPQTRGTWTIAHTPMLVPGLLEIFVCPEGCLRGVVLSAAEDRLLDRFAMVTVKEEDAVDGDMEKLFYEGVCDILDAMETLPPCVMVFTSCVHHFTAIDLPYVMTHLRKRYPQVDWIENYMNCTMRQSKLHYEEVTARQWYAPLGNVEKDPDQVDIIGNYFALDPDSEIYSLLSDQKIYDLPLCETYAEYKEMAHAKYLIYNMPVAKEAARDLQARNGQIPIYIPYTWSMKEIEADLDRLADTLGIQRKDFSRQKELAEKALRKTARLLHGRAVQIDYSATPRPLELACLLLEHGMNVTTVYSDAVLPGEQDALQRLRVLAPEMELRAAVHYRCRLWHDLDPDCLAIGQKATYYSGTRHFVNMVANDGLYGYTGIRKLCEQMQDALFYEKDPAMIEIKAKGCFG